MSDRIAAVVGSSTIERILRLMKSAAVSYSSLLTSKSSNVARTCKPPRRDVAKPEDSTSGALLNSRQRWPALRSLLSRLQIHVRRQASVPASGLFRPVPSFPASPSNARFGCSAIIVECAPADIPAQSAIACCPAKKGDWRAGARKKNGSFYPRVSQPA